MCGCERIKGNEVSGGGFIEKGFEGGGCLKITMFMKCKKEAFPNS